MTCRWSLEVTLSSDFQLFGNFSQTQNSLCGKNLVETSESLIFFVQADL